MRQDFIFKKITAIFLCISFTLTSVGNAADIIPKPAPQAAKIIYYIQDAHDSLEAQKNIAKLVRHFVERGGIKTVFEEGYEGPVPSDELFGLIKNPVIKQKISYFLMDKLRLGGAEYAHINRKKDFKLIGVDNFSLHRKNIEGYKQHARYQKQTGEDLEKMSEVLKKLEQRYLPEPVKRWIKLKKRLDSGQIDILDYVERMKFAVSMRENFASATGGSAYPATADRLRSRRLTRLRRDQAQTAPRAGSGKVFSPKRNPLSMAKQFFREMERLENEFAEKSLADERQRKIFRMHKSLELLKRLNKIELTPAEYEAVQKPLNELTAQDFADWTAQETGKTVVLSNRWEKGIRPAREFYETALAREAALEKPLDDFLRSDETKAVLIYGGFHRGGILEILKRKNIRVKVITPRISGEDPKHQKMYRALMSQGYKPFEFPAALARASRYASIFWDLKFGRKKALQKKFREFELGFHDDPRSDRDARGPESPLGRDGLRSEVRTEIMPTNTENLAALFYSVSSNYARAVGRFLKAKKRPFPEFLRDLGEEDKPGYVEGIRMARSNLEGLFERAKFNFKGIVEDLELSEEEVLQLLYALELQPEILRRLNNQPPAPENLEKVFQLSPQGAQTLAQALAPKPAAEPGVSTADPNLEEIQKIRNVLWEKKFNFEETAEVLKLSETELIDSIIKAGLTLEAGVVLLMERDELFGTFEGVLSKKFRLSPEGAQKLNDALGVSEDEVPAMVLFLEKYLESVDWGEKELERLRTLDDYPKAAGFILHKNLQKAFKKWILKKRFGIPPDQPLSPFRSQSLWGNPSAVQEISRGLNLEFLANEIPAVRKTHPPEERRKIQNAQELNQYLQDFKDGRAGRAIPEMPQGISYAANEKGQLITGPYESAHSLYPSGASLKVYIQWLDPQDALAGFYLSTEPAEEKKPEYLWKGLWPLKGTKRLETMRQKNLSLPWLKLVYALQNEQIDFVEIMAGLPDLFFLEPPSTKGRISSVQMLKFVFEAGYTTKRGPDERFQMLVDPFQPENPFVLKVSAGSETARHPSVLYFRFKPEWPYFSQPVENPYGPPSSEGPEKPSLDIKKIRDVLFEKKFRFQEAALALGLDEETFVEKVLQSDLAPLVKILFQVSSDAMRNSKFDLSPKSAAKRKAFASILESEEAMDEMIREYLESVDWGSEELEQIMSSISLESWTGARNEIERKAAFFETYQLKQAFEKWILRKRFGAAPKKPLSALRGPSLWEDLKEVRALSLHSKFEFRPELLPSAGQARAATNDEVISLWRDFEKTFKENQPDLEKYAAGLTQPLYVQPGTGRYLEHFAFLRSASLTKPTTGPVEIKMFIDPFSYEEPFVFRVVEYGAKFRSPEQYYRMTKKEPYFKQIKNPLVESIDPMLEKVLSIEDGNTAYKLAEFLDSVDWGEEELKRLLPLILANVIGGGRIEEPDFRKYAITELLTRYKIKEAFKRWVLRKTFNLPPAQPLSPLRGPSLWHRDRKMVEQLSRDLNLVFSAKEIPFEAPPADEVRKKIETAEELNQYLQDYAAGKAGKMAPEMARSFSYQIDAQGRLMMGPYSSEAFASAVTSVNVRFHWINSINISAGFYLEVESPGAKPGDEEKAWYGYFLLFSGNRLKHVTEIKRPIPKRLIVQKALEENPPNLERVLASFPDFYIDFDQYKKGARFPYYGQTVPPENKANKYVRMEMLINPFDPENPFVVEVEIPEGRKEAERKEYFRLTKEKPFLEPVQDLYDPTVKPGETVPSLPVVDPEIEKQQKAVEEIRQVLKAKDFRFRQAAHELNMTEEVFMGTLRNLGLEKEMSLILRFKFSRSDATEKNEIPRVMNRFEISHEDANALFFTKELWWPLETSIADYLRFVDWGEKDLEWLAEVLLNEDAKTSFVRLIKTYKLEKFFMKRAVDRAMGASADKDAWKLRSFSFFDRDLKAIEGVSRELGIEAYELDLLEGAHARARDSWPLLKEAFLRLESKDTLKEMIDRAIRPDRFIVESTEDWRKLVKGFWFLEQPETNITNARKSPGGGLKEHRAMFEVSINPFDPESPLILKVSEGDNVHLVPLNKQTILLGPPGEVPETERASQSEQKEQISPSLEEFAPGWKEIVDYLRALFLQSQRPAEEGKDLLTGPASALKPFTAPVDNDGYGFRISGEKSLRIGGTTAPLMVQTINFEGAREVNVIPHLIDPKDPAKGAYLELSFQNSAGPQSLFYDFRIMGSRFFKARKQEKKEPSKAAKAKELLEKYKWMDLATALAESPSEMQQTLAILLTREGVDMDEEELSALNRAFALNLREGHEGGGGGAVEGGRRGDPYQYLQALMGLQEILQKLREDEQEIFVQAFLRLALQSFSRDFDGALRKVKDILGSVSESPFFAALEERIENFLKKAIAYQPDHIKTPMLAHQKVGAWLQRHSENFQNEGIFGFINEDDTRIGKTIETFAAIDPAWKSLIAVPAGVIDNWVGQYRQHVQNGPELILIRGTPAQKRELLLAARERKNILILAGIEDMRHWDEDIFNAVNHGLDAAAVDEGQKIGNYKGLNAKGGSLQAKAIHRLKAPRKWVLSATPFNSKSGQLFSALNWIHTDPVTDEVSNPIFATPESFETHFTRSIKQKTRLYTLKSRFSMRRTKAEMGDSYSKKNEIMPSDLGSYLLSLPQSELILDIIRNLGKYLEVYNRRVPYGERIAQTSVSAWLKLQFLEWAMTDPSFLHENIPTHYWEKMDEIVLPRLEQKKKGEIFFQNIDMGTKIIERYQAKGYRVVRIDGTITGNAVDEEGRPILVKYGKDGKMFRDPEGELITKREYNRRLFQEDPNVDLVVINIAAAVGIDTSSAEWELYAQLPENYVEYYQSSDRSIGLNPLRSSGGRKEVEVITMMARFPNEFLEKIMQTGDKPYVEHGTPAEIAYKLMMGEGREEYEVVMEGLPGAALNPEQKAAAQFVKAIYGFKEDPSFGGVSKKRRKMMEESSHLYPVYQRVKKQKDKVGEQNVFDLVELYAKTEVSALEFGKVVKNHTDFDAEDLILIKGIFGISNKQFRDTILTLLPEVYRRVRENGYKGFTDLIQNSPETLGSLAANQPELFIAFVAATQAWKPHPGASILFDILGEFYAEGLSSYDQNLWVRRYVHGLIHLIDLNNTEFFGLMEHLAPDFGNPSVSLEDKIQFFENLGVLRETKRLPADVKIKFFEALGVLKQASAEAYEEILKMRAPYDEIMKALKTATRDIFGRFFRIEETPEMEQAILAFAREYGNLNAPIQMMSKLRAADQAVYGKHVELFRQMMKHWLGGTLEAWRNQQDRDSTLHDITFLKNRPKFWEVFTREENVPLGDVAVYPGDFLNERKRVVDQILEQLDDLEMLKNTFGAAGDLVYADNNDAKSKETLEELIRQKGIARGLMDKADVPGIQKAEEELRDLRLRKNIQFLQAGLRKSGLNFEEIGKLLGDIQQVIAKRKDGELQMTPLQLLLANLAANLEESPKKKIFEEVEVEITSNPDLIMRRGMLIDELINCFNLNANVKQIATLLDDLVSRNKMLALVRVKGKLAAVAMLKVRNSEDPQKSDAEKPVIMIEMPLARWGYKFEREIAKAVELSKLSDPEMADTGIAGTWTKSKDIKERVKLYPTGARGPTEYFEPLFGVRERERIVFHHARMIVSPKKTMRSEMRAPLLRSLFDHPRREVLDFGFGLGEILREWKLDRPSWIAPDARFQGAELPRPIEYTEYAKRGVIPQDSAGDLKTLGIHVMQDSEPRTHTIDLLHVSFLHAPDETFPALEKYEKQLSVGGWILIANSDQLYKREGMLAWLRRRGYREENIRIFDRDTGFPGDYQPSFWWNYFKRSRQNYLIAAQKNMNDEFRSEMRSQKGDRSEVRKVDDAKVEELLKALAPAVNLVSFEEIFRGHTPAAPMEEVLGRFIEERGLSRSIQGKELRVMVHPLDGKSRLSYQGFSLPQLWQRYRYRKYFERLLKQLEGDQAKAFVVLIQDYSADRRKMIDFLSFLAEHQSRLNPQHVLILIPTYFLDPAPIVFGPPFDGGGTSMNALAAFIRKLSPEPKQIAIQGELYKFIENGMPVHGCVGGTCEDLQKRLSDFSFSFDQALSVQSDKVLGEKRSEMRDRIEGISTRITSLMMQTSVSSLPSRSSIFSSFSGMGVTASASKVIFWSIDSNKAPTWEGVKFSSFIQMPAFLSRTSTRLLRLGMAVLAASSTQVKRNSTFESRSSIFSMRSGRGETASAIKSILWSMASSMAPTWEAVKYSSFIKETLSKIASDGTLSGFETVVKLIINYFYYSDKAYFFESPLDRDGRRSEVRSRELKAAVEGVFSRNGRFDGPDLSQRTTETEMTLEQKIAQVAEWFAHEWMIEKGRTPEELEGFIREAIPTAEEEASRKTGIELSRVRFDKIRVIFQSLTAAAQYDYHDNAYIRPLLPIENRPSLEEEKGSIYHELAHHLINIGRSSPRNGVWDGEQFIIQGFPGHPYLKLDSSSIDVLNGFSPVAEKFSKNPRFYADYFLEELVVMRMLLFLDDAFHARMTKRVNESKMTTPDFVEIEIQNRFRYMANYVARELEQLVQTILAAETLGDHEFVRIAETNVRAINDHYLASWKYLPADLFDQMLGAGRAIFRGLHLQGEPENFYRDIRSGNLRSELRVRKIDVKKIVGHPTPELFLNEFKSFRKKYGDAFIEKHWPEIVRLGNTLPAEDFSTLFKSVFPRLIKGSITLPWVEARWPEIVKMLETSGKTAVNFLETHLRHFMRDHGRDWVNAHWKDLLQLVDKSKTYYRRSGDTESDLLDVLWWALFNFKEKPGGQKWIEEHWDGLLKMALNNDPSELHHILHENLPKLAEVFPSYDSPENWPRIVFLASGTGKNLLPSFLIMLDGGISSFRIDWDSLNALLSAAKSDAFLFMSATLHGLEKQIKSREDFRKIADVLTALVKQWHEEKKGVSLDDLFFLTLPALQRFITPDNLNTVGEDLLKRDRFYFRGLKMFAGKTPLDQWSFMLDQLELAEDEVKDPLMIYPVFENALPQLDFVTLENVAEVVRDLVTLAEEVKAKYSDNAKRGTEAQWFFSKAMYELKQRGVEKENFLTKARAMMQTGSEVWSDFDLEKDRVRHVLGVTDDWRKYESDSPSSNIDETTFLILEAQTERLQSSAREMKAWTQDPNPMIKADAQDLEERLSRAATRLVELEPKLRRMKEAADLYQVWEKRMTALMGKMIKEYRSRLEENSLDLGAHAGDESSIASVSTGIGLQLVMRTGLEMRFSQQILPLLSLHGLVMVDEELALKHAEKFIRALNALVPHELSHVLYDQKKGKRWSAKLADFDPAPFAALGTKEDILAIAKEVIIDKLGYELATRVYMHSEHEPSGLSGKEKAVAALQDTIEIFLEHMQSERMRESVDPKKLVLNLARFEAALNHHLVSSPLAARLHSLAATLIADGEKLAVYDQLVQAFKSAYAATQLEITPKRSEVRSIPELGEAKRPMTILMSRATVAEMTDEQFTAFYKVYAGRSEIRKVIYEEPGQKIQRTELLEARVAQLKQMSGVIESREDGAGAMKYGIPNQPFFYINEGGLPESLRHSRMALGTRIWGVRLKKSVELVAVPLVFEPGSAANRVLLDGGDIVGLTAFERAYIQEWMNQQVVGWSA